MGRSVGQLLAGGGVAQATWDDQNRRYRDDAFTEEARRLALEAANADANLRPARHAAELARLGVATDSANAQRTLIPGATANKQKALGLEGRGLDEEGKNFDTQAGINRDVLAANRNKAKIQLEESNLALEQWPSAAKRARVQGLIDDQKAGMWGLAGLHYAMLSGSSQQLLAYVNAAAKEGLIPGMEQAEFVGAEMFQDATDQNGQKVGNVLQFKTKDGRMVNFSTRAIEQAYNTVSPREIKEVGGRLVSIGASGDVRTLVGQPDKWKTENGVAINEATGETRNLGGGAGVSQEQVRLLTNDGVNQISLAYGAKQDPVTKMLDPESIQDKAGYFQAIAEAEKRIRAGEKPMAVAGDIAKRALDTQKAEKVAPSEGRSPAVDQILKDHGWTN